MTPSLLTESVLRQMDTPSRNMTNDMASLLFKEFFLTLKVPITTAAEDPFNFYYYYYSQKISLDISCESSAKQMIHMKCQDFFL